MGNTWEPTDDEKKRYDFKIAPLVSNDWTVLSGQTPEKNGKAEAQDVKSVQRMVIMDATAASSDGDGADDEYGGSVTERNPVWNGTLLPKSDADLWLTTAFADYERIVAQERQMKVVDEEKITLAMYAHWIKYRMAIQRLGKDIPLNSYQSNPRENDGYDLAAGKGVLVMAALRKELGAKSFDDVMDQFGRAYAGKEVTTAEFQEHLEKSTGKNLGSFFQQHVLGAKKNGASKPVWSIFGWDKSIEQTLIIYGTQAEAAANREAAQRLQNVVARRWGNYRPAIKADVDVTESEIKDKNLLLIGRPEANTLVSKIQGQLPVKFGHRSFEVQGTTYASELSGAIVAGAHPHHLQRCMVVFAVLSAESTWKLVAHMCYTPCDVQVV